MARALLMEYWPVFTVFILFIVCWPGAYGGRREHYTIFTTYGYVAPQGPPQACSPACSVPLDLRDWRSVNDEHVPQTVGSRSRRSTALQMHFLGDAGREHTTTGSWPGRALIRAFR